MSKALQKLFDRIEETEEALKQIEKILVLIGPGDLERSKAFACLEIVYKLQRGKPDDNE